MLKIIFFLLTLFLFDVTIFAQLTIKITSVPAGTPASDSIYVAGNFNNWNPGAPNFILQKQANGTRQIVINPPTGQVEFKFTRGNWATVEGTAQNTQRANRIFQYNGQPQTLELKIEGWENATPRTSTATANVRIVSQDFFIPQLNRNRRIWMYLPLNYETSGQRYPVLYMHDGQNLFDAATAGFGEWKVDETLNMLYPNNKGAIVVGIDNGGSNRLNEYSPWVNTRYGGGEGDEYAEFMVKTLKPYVDANYRTRPEREQTGIMGSSMGGLISLYMALEYQETFSKAGIFSPAFWFAPQSYAHVSSEGRRADMRIYLLAGQQEDNGSVVAAVNAMYNTLRNAGFKESEVQRVTHPDGQHSEWYWAREFSTAFQWLFNNATTSTRTPQWTSTFTLSPNPADTVIWVKSSTTLAEPSYAIYDMNGKVIQAVQRLQQQKIDIAKLAAGTYVLVFYNKKQLIESRKVIVK